MKFLKSAFRKKIFVQILFLVTAITVIGSIGYSGYLIGKKYPQNLIVKGVANIETDPKALADFSVFWQAWGILKNEHIKGAEAKEKDLVYGAITGLTNSLGDPNTVFFPPEDGKKFEQDVAGNFGGIGAEIGIKNDQLVIIAPLKDSPAEKIGLKSGDKIIKINGDSTEDIKVNDAVKKIRGELGTKVTLTILRNGWDKTKDFTITRAPIMIPTMDWKMLKDDIGYIRVRGFNENAPRLFFDAASELLGKGVNGMIIDVRDNPGGFLEVAVNLSGWFMDKGSLVTKQEFRDKSQNREFRSYGTGILQKVPIVVLINQGSASASEILAGALRDNIGAILVGEKSFGKGTVQEVRHLKDGSSLKVTISHWLLPKGDLIEKNGIKPQYEVKISEEDSKALKDTQLEKAEAIMAELVKKALVKQQ